ncbi:MAG: EamA family transporter [Lachnospiraceae bacterium]|nr:EamA family transporter [Lachnospiraceae bacterium]
MINRYIVIMFLSVSAASVSQLLLKKSAMKKYVSVIKEYLNPLVIGGYGILFLSMLLTIYAYSGMDYKNGPIIESFGNVIVLVLGYLFLKEKISFKKLIGIACIMVGMAVFYS